MPCIDVYVCVWLNVCIGVPMFLFFRIFWVYEKIDVSTYILLYTDVWICGLPLSFFLSFFLSLSLSLSLYIYIYIYIESGRKRD